MPLLPDHPFCLQVLAGLLHLGNVHFADSEDEAQPCQLMDGTKGERQGWWDAPERRVTTVIEVQWETES